MAKGEKKQEKGVSFLYAAEGEKNTLVAKKALRFDI